MEEVNKLAKEGPSSATCSKRKGSSSNDGLMTIISPEEFKVLIAGQNTDFYKAVCSGNGKKVASMLQENPGLAEIKLPNGMLPIDMAASCGHDQVVTYLYLSLGNKVDDLTGEHREKLFFTTLKNNIFGVAHLMLSKYPTLAVSRDEEQFTALHVLARKSPKEFYVEDHKIAVAFRMFGTLALTIKLWELTRGMERNDQMLGFTSEHSEVLFEAAKSGNFLIYDILLKSNPELLMVLDSKRRSLFHISVLYRQGRVLLSIMKNGEFKELVMQTVDDDGNSVLHMAGMSPLDQIRSTLAPPEMLMQRELLLYKGIEKMVPAAFQSMRNKKGQTPEDIFYSTHSELIASAKLAMKDKANYGMVVATIIATIVFAASLTVPGHDVSPDASSLILQKQGWFIVFFVTNSGALFSSSASIVFFLTVLTSGHTEDEFNISLLLRLTSGVIALFVAITAMVVAFIAACFLIFDHHSTWVAYLVASLSFLTVALFIFLLYTLFRELIALLYSPMALMHHPSPTNNYQRLKSNMTNFVGWMKEFALKIPPYLLKMCQNAKAKLLFQEDNRMADP